jgi:hypothetical protein
MIKKKKITNKKVTKKKVTKKKVTKKKVTKNTNNNKLFMWGAAVLFLVLLAYLS